MGAMESKQHSQNGQLKSTRKESKIHVFHTKDKWMTFFNSSKANDKLLVIDFTATWCGPCQSMESILKQFSETYQNVDFVKLDVDEVPDVAAEFGVQAMPTFLLIKRGDQVDKVVGAKKDDLWAKIERHMN